jgi:hypothetical protein
MAVWDLNSNLDVFGMQTFMDETGVFFKDTTRKTFHINDEDCPCGKRSKERFTPAFCASLTGEKLEPLIKTLWQYGI